MGVADVLRTEWPLLVATLTRNVGDLGIAEDAAQDAFLEPSVRWPTDGVPERPGAWLVTTGRRNPQSFQRGGAFQFQAAIAALHATGPTFEATDRPAVLRLYDVLLQRQQAC